jgi:hypothetical protein
MLDNQDTAADTPQSERVTARGDLFRRRTMVGVRAEGDQLLRVVDESTCRRGRVVSFIGLTIQVRCDSTGEEFACSVRGILRSLARDARNVVVTGDCVLFRQEGDAYQGVIERVEPRHGILSRGSHGREHILVANIDQVLIVASAADPEFRPQLVDRYLICAEERGILPIVCVSKIDLADLRSMLPNLLRVREGWLRGGTGQYSHGAGNFQTATTVGGSSDGGQWPERSWQIVAAQLHRPRFGTGDGGRQRLDAQRDSHNPSCATRQSFHGWLGL